MLVWKPGRRLFMIMTNLTNISVQEKGLKDVQFVMMLSIDTKQDDHACAVACAKAKIYGIHLPTQVNKVIFRSDGAGCFKSIFHRAMQPHWKTWTGIEEMVFRVTPAGDGKFIVGGMFG